MNTPEVRSKSLVLRLFAVLCAMALFATACGGDAETASAKDCALDIPSSDATPAAKGPYADFSDISVAIVAPSASDDLAFTQSMVDAVAAMGITPKITDGTFVVEEAGAAIRGYAEEGIDVVIAHGTQYGGSLEEIAPEFPETTFLFGTATDTRGLDNVFAYYPDADEGGYVQGILAASLSDNGKIGVVGPVEAGDAVAYIDGFVNGVVACGVAAPSVTYTGSFGDVALAKEAAEAHLATGADTMTGSAQMVVGATGVAAANDMLWFGTQANQSSLAPNLVVSSQVYHWEVILDQALTLRQQGVVGGEVFGLTLANGGLEIEFNDGYALPDDVKTRATNAVAAIMNGTIDTGVN